MARRLVRTKGYKLPPGPRGDAPGGVGTPSHPYGNRTGDTRRAGAYTEKLRKYPNAPFGRYDDGEPLPETMVRKPGNAIPNARRPRRQSIIPKGQTNYGERRGAFRKQKGWNS